MRLLISLRIWPMVRFSASLIPRRDSNLNSLDRAAIPAHAFVNSVVLSMC